MANNQIFKNQFSIIGMKRISGGIRNQGKTKNWKLKAIVFQMS